MTAIVANTDALLLRIHETAYWRILLRPSEYDAQRLPTLQACRDAIEKCAVRLRGWGFPEVDPDGGLESGDGWIQSGNDFSNHVELWRFYRSGQFVYHGAERGQRVVAFAGQVSPLAGQVSARAGHVSFIEVLYTTTEILEFTRNLAYVGVLSPEASISIELHNVPEFKLVGDNGPLRKEYRHHGSEPIIWKTHRIAPALVANAPSYALDATVSIIERFGWLDVSRPMLVERQKRLLERRL